MRTFLLFICLFSFQLLSQTNNPTGRYFCSQNNKGIYIVFKRGKSVLFKEKGKLGFSMKLSDTSKPGMLIYNSKEGSVRVEFNNDIIKVSTSLKRSDFKRHIFSNCLDLDAPKVDLPKKKELTTILKNPTKATRKASKVSSEVSIFRDSSERFTNFGKLSRIKFIPDNSPLNFEYDVLYYIPQKLRGKRNLKTLVFLHGGGDSTNTRYKSLKVTNDYARELVPIAEKLGIVLILPSASGLNWSSHMLNYLRQLNLKIKKELEVDPNKIGLSGHSMGGMGITRSAHWLADEYSFFFPIAAGIDSDYMITDYMSTYFNFTYHHLQGLRDHLKVFISRSKKQKRFIFKLERKKSRKTRFSLEFYNGGHNYPIKKFETLIEKLFKENTRDLYQKELFAIFYNRDETIDNKWGSREPYYLAPRDTYFWIKALEFSKDKTVIPVNIKIKGQNINLTLKKGVKKMRVYLSSKMINLNSMIVIKVNGTTKYSQIPSLNTDMTEELNRDLGFKFDGFIDISI